MKETVKDRIMEFLNSEGIPRTRFEKSIGVSNAYLLKLRGTPKVDKLNKIYEVYPHLNKIWLLTGEGEMYSDTTNAENFYGETKGRKKQMILQVINHYTSGDNEIFAKLVNVSVETIETWIRKGNFDVERVFNSCSDLSAVWLLTGEGNMLYNDDPQISKLQKENDFLRGKIDTYENILKAKGLL